MARRANKGGRRVVGGADGSGVPKKPIGPLKRGASKGARARGTAAPHLRGGRAGCNVEIELEPGTVVSLRKPREGLELKHSIQRTSNFLTGNETPGYNGIEGLGVNDINQQDVFSIFKRLIPLVDSSIFPMDILFEAKLINDTPASDKYLDQLPNVVDKVYDEIAEDIKNGRRTRRPLGKEVMEMISDRFSDFVWKAEAAEASAKTAAEAAASGGSAEG